ncbi:MAG TPA: DUF2007 domain-containing protein [Rhizomicrobium sp.]|jgi:hypothetical protein|nr:DUF2007 domain-containing protein [Rhizomicrobium sp.]
MRPVLQTNNAVQLNFAEAVLRDGGIASFVFDAQMSANEGSLGVLPRRLMVADDDFDRALELLRASLGQGPVEA